jgi:hypothetical protein
MPQSIKRIVNIKENENTKKPPIPCIITRDESFDSRGATLIEGA